MYIPEISLIFSLRFSSFLTKKFLYYSNKQLYNMYNEVVIAILSYTIVMFVFNLVKDYIVRNHKGSIPKEHLDKANTRWWIAYIGGVILLWLMYSRGSPW